MDRAARLYCVFQYNKQAFVFFRNVSGDFFVAPIGGSSVDVSRQRKVSIIDAVDVFIDSDIQHVRIVCSEKRSYLTYLHKKKNGSELVIASGASPEHFKITYRGPYSGGPVCVVPDRKIKQHTLLFSGDGSVDVSFLDSDGKFVEHLRDFVVPQQHPHFYEPVHYPLAAMMLEDGIAVFYDSTKETEKEYEVRIGLVYCDIEDMHVLLCRSEEVPYWSGRFLKKKGRPECVGAFLIDDHIHLYFLQGNDLFRLKISRPLPHIVPVALVKLVVLERHSQNPILSPISQHNWESEGTFNPGVVDVGERIHVFYRAVGSDGVSRIGYASSSDGFSIDSRSNVPVLDGIVVKQHSPRTYRRKHYPSGASAGGLEDPRAVQIGNKVYLTYSSFDHWDSIRMMMTSILVDDLLAGRWRWSAPVYLSPEKELHKNWVLFPEKIHGKFAIIHAISPSILIEYVDDISHFKKGKHIQSRRPAGGRLDSWDNNVRGIGPPPIKTELGWLVFYHATSVRDPNKYKLGAMILDLNHPEKILYRSAGPVLSPEMEYENYWKPGVVYASGAVVRNGKVYVYYGGGDMVVAVATCDLADLLNHLKENAAYIIPTIKKYRVRA